MRKVLKSHKIVKLMWRSQYKYYYDHFHVVHCGVEVLGITLHPTN